MVGDGALQGLLEETRNMPAHKSQPDLHQAQRPDIQKTVGCPLSYLSSIPQGKVQIAVKSGGGDEQGARVRRSRSAPCLTVGNSLKQA